MKKIYTLSFVCVLLLSLSAGNPSSSHIIDTISPCSVSLIKESLDIEHDNQELSNTIETDNTPIKKHVSLSDIIAFLAFLLGVFSFIYSLRNDRKTKKESIKAKAEDDSLRKEISDQKKEVMKSLSAQTNQVRTDLSKETNSLREKLNADIVNIHDKSIISIGINAERGVFMDSLKMFQDIVKETRHEYKGGNDDYGFAAFKSYSKSQRLLIIAYVLIDFLIHEDKWKAFNQEYKSHPLFQSIIADFNNFEIFIHAEIKRQKETIKKIKEFKEYDDKINVAFAYNYQQFIEYRDKEGFLANAAIYQMVINVLKIIPDIEFYKNMTGEILLCYYKSENFKEIYNIYSWTANTIYDHNEAELGKYFRNVYYNLDLIRQFEYCQESQKTTFIKMFRAQLSRYELAILFFNSLSSRSTIKTVLLYCKADIFNNLNLFDLLLPYSQVNKTILLHKLKEQHFINLKNKIYPK